MKASGTRVLKREPARRLNWYQRSPDSCCLSNSIAHFGVIAWERSRAASANGIIWGDAGQNKLDCSADSEVLQSNQVKRTPQYYIKEFII